MKHFNQITF